MATARSIAERYHDLTRYTEESVRNSPGLDWTKQPSQFKEIVSSHRVPLREHGPFRFQEGMPVLDPEEVAAAGPLDLGKLSRLLFFTNGVTGLIRYEQGGGHFLRAAPSAGALYPTEIYVAAHSCDGLAPGIYNYQARTHELVRLWDDDAEEVIRTACGNDAPARASLSLLFTGIFWRSAWRYRERGYRRVLLDTGHVLGNLVTYATQLGCTTHTCLGFVDAVLNGLLFFDDAVEATLGCVFVEQGEASPARARLWSSPTTRPRKVAAREIDSEASLAESATVALHRASVCPDPSPAEDTDASPVAEGAIPLAPPAALEAEIPSAILHRRSARRYLGTSVPFSSVGQALGFAFGRVPRQAWPSRAAGLLNAHLVAHAVDGLEQGLYRVEGAGEALLPLAVGDLRDRLFRVTLGQEIARECAAVLILSAPARAAVARYGDRCYRYLHLEAGEIGERFQLAARGLSLGTCAVAGFFDDEVAELIEIPKRDFVLYLVTIGQGQD